MDKKEETTEFIMDRHGNEFEGERIEAIREMGIEGTDDERKISCMNILSLYIEPESKKGWRDYDAISAMCSIAMSGSDTVKEKVIETIKKRCDEIIKVLDD